MKIYAYTVFIIILMILFHIGGFSFVLNSNVLNALGFNNLDTSGFLSGSFWATLILVFGAVSATGAIIGTIAGVSWTFVLKGLFVMTPLTYFILDLINILNLVHGTWVFWVMSIIIIPLAGAYAIALLEMWDGRD